MRPAVSAWRRALGMALTLGGLVAAGSAGAAPENDAAAGKRLYQEGITADGAPVQAVTQGDVAVRGESFACVACHRTSGFGSSEGGVYVPPITADFLFSPSEYDRKKRNERFKELFKEAQPNSFWNRVRQARARPAYDRQSLGRALRQGIDPAGRTLHRLMPRYRLSDQDVANLAAYLRTLSAEIDPGVGEETIHFATVIAPGADPERRKVFRDTLGSFFDWMNADTANDQSFPDFSPYYRSEFLHAYRHWKLHVWTLEGPPASWRAQLDALYDEQKVFALVSGLVPNRFAPVADFCDAKRLPCLFPHTPLPRTAEAEGAYSLYFNAGLELQGRVAAESLGASDAAAGGLRQVHIAGPLGAAPAGSLAEAAEAAGDAVETQTAADPDALRAAIRTALADGDSRPLAIWPGHHTGAAVAALNAAAPRQGTAGKDAPPILLPASALDAAQADLDPALAERVRLVWPYELPTAYHPRRFRIHAWFNTRGLGTPLPRLQLNTYYALTMVQYSLEHMIDDFFRDYMIEIIEHEAENRLNPGTFPKMALGPGQRFASKGAYLVALDAGAKGGFRPTTDWIVP